MILRCEVCNGTKNVFHPGKANPEPCPMCSDRGLEVDAVIALMRATDMPVNACLLFCCYAVSNALGVDVELLKDAVRKRLEAMR